MKIFPELQASEIRPFSPEEVLRIREDFPYLHAVCKEGRGVIYLDNAATSQKPATVIEALRQYYTAENANVHRGIHHLSELATLRYEEARQKAAAFLGASDVSEIVFTRNATEGVNLVAQSYLRPRLVAGDEVLISVMEHHSNIVPWQMACEAAGAHLRVIPMDDAGNLSLEELDSLLTKRTKLLAVTHVSNVLGTVNPVGELVVRAHAAGIPVLVDGAQSAPRLPVDVTALGCDFYVCSAHKMLGPTGIGLLYGRRELLEAMPPWQGGGNMIHTVSFDKTTYGDSPARFEAGTPHIAGAAGLIAAIDYLEQIGRDRIAAHEYVLADRVVRVLGEVEGVRVLGAPRERIGVVPFVMEGVHAHDVAQVLDDHGIAVRAGHLCAQPLMERLGVATAVRVSPAFYNTPDEIDALIPALHAVRRIFR